MGQEVRDCMAHVSRVFSTAGEQAKGSELALQGWPVLSTNEWGKKQSRMLILSTHALYRIDYRSRSGAPGTVDHTSKQQLCRCLRIDQEIGEFSVVLVERDGKSNFLADAPC